MLFLFSLREIHLNFRSFNYLISDLPDVETSFVHNCYNSFMSLLDQVANDLIVKVFNVLPSYPFLLVLFLFLFQNQLCDKIFIIIIASLISLKVFLRILSITLTDKKLLQLFVAIIDAKLLEAIHVKDFKAVDIEHAD